MARSPRATVEIAASVTGDEALSTLAADLDRLPARTTAAVAASVTGDQAVSDLAGDLDGLPATTKAGVTASVTGDQAVSDLAGDLDGLPATTKAAVAADITGATALDALITDLQKIPPTTTAKVSVTAMDGSATKPLRDSLQGVKGDAEDAAGEVSGFASEITGTLGGQFSEGAGYVSDFAEQFRNLRERVKESDDKIGTVAAAAAGIGATLVAGFGIDAIIGLFGQMNKAAEESQAAVEALSAQIVESGGLIDANFKKLQIQQVVDPGTETGKNFQTLINAGLDYNTVLDAILGDSKAMATVQQEINGHVADYEAQVNKSGAVNRGPNGPTQQAKKWEALGSTLDETSKSVQSNGLAAVTSGRQLQNYYVKAGLAEDQVGKTANGVDLLSAAMQTNATKTSTATGKISTYNATDLKDKESTLTATDHATPTVNTYNGKQLLRKTGELTATDNASATVDAFNRKPISDKTATVGADTDPAKTEIDQLNGRSVTVPVQVRIQNMTPAQQRRLFGEVVTGSFTASSPTPAPRLAPVPAAVTTAPVTAPITINVSGALDPVATARQINQVLTRAQRRTGPFRTGGQFGVEQAPV